MSTKNYIPEELIKKAEQTSILDFCMEHNIEVVKVTNKEYMLADNNSLKINVVDNLYNDFGLASGTKLKGGNVISFARHTLNVSFADAIPLILESKHAGELNLKKAPHLSKNKGGFNYPKYIVRSDNKHDKALEYLTKERGLNENIIKKFLKEGLIQETKNGDILFNWKEPFSKQQSIVGGSIQGTEPLKNPLNEKRKFKKLILKNSTSGYGFNFKGKEEPENIVFAESPIDAISYFENKILKNDDPLNYAYQSIEGLKFSIIEKTIEQYKQEYKKYPREVVLAFDNDIKGKDAFLEYQDRDIFTKNDITVKSGIPKKDTFEKMDWNDRLKLKKGFYNQTSEQEISKSKGLSI